MPQLTRRSLLLSVPALAIAAPAFASGSFTDYTPGLIEDLLKDGKTVFVDYHATWCSTCARQERVIESLLSTNPGYKQAMSFVRVDWDIYSAAAVTTSRKIPRRSTLLVLKGDAELGRIVAGTSEADIKALLDTGMKAA